MSPINTELFESLMDRLGPFESCPEIAVAVSGGVDSMGLTILLNEWVTKQNGRLHAITIDHGLRDESASEAEFVSNFLNENNVLHRIIHVKSLKKAEAGLQEKAREKRYAELLDYCRTNSILHLFLGHHQDDQIETYWQRKENKSENYGLLGMSKITYLDDSIRLLRPLLNISKQKIIDFCQDKSIPWVEDSSNKNINFSRVKYRNLKNKFNKYADEWHEWYPDASIHERDQIDCIHSFIAKYVSLHPLGFIRIDRLALLELDIPLQRQVLRQLVKAMSPHKYYPTRLSIFAKGLENAFPAGKKYCAHYCKLFCRKAEIILARDYHHISKQSTAWSSEDMIWDHRFKLKRQGKGEISVSPLGPKKLLEYKKNGLNDNLFKWPDEVFYSLPCLSRLDGWEYVPYLNKYNDYNEEYLIDIELDIAPKIGLDKKS